MTRGSRRHFTLDFSLSAFVLIWLSHDLNMIRYLIPLVDLMTSTVALLLAQSAAHSTSSYLGDINHALLILGCAIVSVLVFYSLGTYKSVPRYFGPYEFFNVVKVLFVQILIFYLVSLSPLGVLSGGAVLVYSLQMFALSSISRIFISRLSLSDTSVPSAGGEPPMISVLIYGAGEAGIQVATHCSGKSGYSLKGYIDDNRMLHGRLINGVGVFGPEDVPDLINRHGIQEIFIALPSVNSPRYYEILGFLSQFKIRLKTLPKLKDLYAEKVGLNDIKEIRIEDILFRQPIEANPAYLSPKVAGKVVMVTGASGSIGSELCKIILSLKPDKLILVDFNEFGLYQIAMKLNEVATSTEAKFCEIIPLLVSVADKSTIFKCISTFRPDTIYHAAAYKHVTIVEENLCSGIFNNVWGTLYTAQAAYQSQVKDFILISTDKAVRPTNAMGASKRICELILQALADSEYQNQIGHKTNFSMVRFGNVLGSSGSVVPLFLEQIRSGRPVTVRHPDVTRFFMTIKEAAQLVLQAGSLSSGGEVYVLDMGEPVKILDLAKNIIELSGLQVKSKTSPYGTVEIVFTGLAPGEKLYEELLIGNKPRRTQNPKILVANEHYIQFEDLIKRLDSLKHALDDFDAPEIYSALSNIVPEFQMAETSVDRIADQALLQSALQ